MYFDTVKGDISMAIDVYKNMVNRAHAHVGLVQSVTKDQYSNITIELKRIDTHTGNFKLSSFGLIIIDRLVVNGNGLSQGYNYSYGDAFGGVINVLDRDPFDLEWLNGQICLYFIHEIPRTNICSNIPVLNDLMPLEFLEFPTLKENEDEENE